MSYPPSQDDQDDVYYQHPDGTLEAFPPGTTPEEITKALNAQGIPTKFSPLDLSKKAETPATPATPPTAAPTEKSVAGFLGNLGTSTAGQVGNIVQAVTSPIQTAKGLGNLALGIGEKVIPGTQAHEPYADALGQFYADRYGSLDKLTESAYSDPAGVAMDVATLAGGAGGGLRVLGRVGNLPRVVQVGQALSAAEAATNPVRLATKLPNVALRATGRGVIRGTGPSLPRALQKKFDVTPTDVAETIMDRRLVTDAGAGNKANASIATARDMVEAAELGGTPGGHAVNIANAVWMELQPELAKRPRAGGYPDVTPQLIERLEEFVRQHPGVDIPLTDLDDLKRTMQSIAYEPGQASNWLNKKIDTAFAKLFKGTLEDRVPGLGAQNRESQKLIAAERAIRNAETGPSGGQMPTAVGLGTAIAGSPEWAPLTYAATKIASQPAAGRIAGIGLGMGGAAIDSATLRRLAMLRALQEAGTPDASTLLSSVKGQEVR